MGLTLLAAAWLAGCGQRGPLYLPTDASTTAPTQVPSEAATPTNRP